MSRREELAREIAALDESINEARAKHDGIAQAIALLERRCQDLRNEEHLFKWSKQELLKEAAALDAAPGAYP